MHNRLFIGHHNKRRGKFLNVFGHIAAPFLRETVWLNKENDQSNHNLRNEASPKDIDRMTPITK